MKKISLVLIAIGSLLGACQSEALKNKSDGSSPISEQSGDVDNIDDNTSNGEGESNNNDETSPTSDDNTGDNEDNVDENGGSTTHPEGDVLPIGNSLVSGPANLDSPVPIADYTEFTFNFSLPPYFSYIQGNKKFSESSKGDYYQDDGSFKFRKQYYGFQTCAFTTFQKLEVRLTISQVNDSNKKANKNDDSFMHVYGYNNNEQYIYIYKIEQGKLEKNTQEIRFYLTNADDISYLEFRLSNYPYKGSQCYNFGVNALTLKGWPYQ